VPPRTGELCVARGIATAEQVEKAVRESRARGEPLCSRLLALGVDEGELVSILAERHGAPGVDLSRSAVALDILDLVPRAVAEGDLMLPVAHDGGRIHVAMARPWDERVVSELRFATGREVSAYVAIRGALLRAIGEAYEARARGKTLWRGKSSASGVPHLAAVVPGAPAAATVELIPDADVVIEVDAEGLPPPERAVPLVLVVDDEPEIRALVQRTLESRGYAVETAADGAEGIAKADALQPDLVLLDAMLPKVHGFEACRRLKSSPRTRDVPVVMMTAIFRGWRFAQDARETYGAEDYIEKPFRREDFLRRVDAVLETSASRPKAPPPGADPHLATGKELLVAGRLPEAVAELEKAIAADPWSADAHHHLARALRAQGEPFRAMTSLERATELRPGHLAALRSLATLYEEKGFRRKAAETLERALGAAADDATRGAIKQDLIGLLE
jgi:DNA-binding response OmpR family regulator/Fe2+ transport system protein FeoA